MHQHFHSAQRWEQFWRVTVRKTFSDNFSKAMSRLLTSSGYVEFTSLCAFFIIISVRAKCELILHLDDNSSVMKSAIIDIYLEPGRGLQGRMSTMCIWAEGPLSFLLCESTMIETIWKRFTAQKWNNAQKLVCVYLSRWTPFGDVSLDMGCLAVVEASHAAPEFKHLQVGKIILKRCRLCRDGKVCWSDLSPWL